MHKSYRKIWIVTNIFLVAVILAELVFLSVFSASRQTDPVGNVTFENGTSIVVEIADTPRARAIGLSGRASLDDSSGMLFIFEEENVPSFWMKGMNFPIDMIWIRDSVIIGVEKTVPVDEGISLDLYSPRQTIDMVLEVKSGFFDRFDLEIGQTVDIRL